MIQMPVLVKVKCESCEATDKAWWSEYGAEQPCLNCGAAPIELIKVGA